MLLKTIKRDLDANKLLSAESACVVREHNGKYVVIDNYGTVTKFKWWVNAVSYFDDINDGVVTDWRLSLYQLLLDMSGVLMLVIGLLALLFAY